MTTGVPLYLTPGNFPSVAANSIQVAKMAAAFTRFLPDLEVVSLSGLLRQSSQRAVDLSRAFGLTRPLKMRYIPFLFSHKGGFFDEGYRPPSWFYGLVGHYARLRKATLVFTRKPKTAWVTVNAGIKTVLESHDPFGEGEWGPVPSRILTHENLACLVVISAPLAERLLKGGARRETIVVAPDGVDLEQFDPPVDKKDARTRLAMDHHSFTCVYSGHLHPGRGVDEILDAAALLPAVQFVFVGGWPRIVNQYRHLARKRRLLNVTFCGCIPQSKVPLYLFAADALLMPYNSTLQTADRCSPLKMFEYLASGRPVLSSDLPVLRAVLHHEVNALMIPPDSGALLASAISRLMKDPKLAQRLGNAGRRDSFQYAWEERAKRILRVASGEI